MGTSAAAIQQHLLVDIAVPFPPPPALQAKMSVRGLCKTSESTGEPILRGVSVDLQAGQVLGIIGPSGGGKSTLLRALNRLWEPAAGTVFLDGTDIRCLDVISLRRRVGMLFQLPALFNGTVGDNVRYGPQLRGKKLTDSEVNNLLSMADIDPSLASKPASNLSVGQAQRVALARTLANDPEVLLLDEPTSALDPISTQNRFRELLTLSACWSPARWSNCSLRLSSLKPATQWPAAFSSSAANPFISECCAKIATKKCCGEIATVIRMLCRN